ncbi:MAG TPA: UDP-N-acetylmuramoyl-tripeptide--D-alanyl-D-alanine ligase [Saprospiraceae bacterium]|nr:UDP-N-acetylmuramoyl-tripeptide--D-alanyl-D-alanine ligase [Saprospiraceae bacterium]
MLINFFLNATGVSTDTRTVKEGDLFFALKGDNFDGNQYANLALQKGASYAIVDDVSLKDSHPQLIYVEDTLKSLQDLARSYRRYLNKPVIALTGSNGKTTTKELINIVLSKKYKVHCTKGNLNNHIGVPLTILSCPKDIDFLLIEMGANHQGEIDTLCSIAEPDYGMITNIGKAHLEGFGGIEGVKKGKSELYRYLSNKEGVIFCNEGDAVLLNLLPKEGEVIHYNTNATTIESPDFLKFMYKDLLFETKLFGSHNMANAIAAIEIGIYFNVSTDNIVSAIKQYIPENNRSQVALIGGKKIIKDAYNSNPSSLMASLVALLKQYEAKKLVLILGDMLELGVYSDEEHQKILEFINSYDFQSVWLIGKEFLKHKATGYDFNFYETTDEAKNEFDTKLYSEETIIFLKGSRGIAVENILK